MLYYFQPNVILLFIRSNITSEQRVYTLRAKGIYPTTERYIPHDRKVYSSRQKGIFLTTARYIPSYGKLLSFVCALQKIAFNSSRCVALKTVPALR